MTDLVDESEMGDGIDPDEIAMRTEVARVEPKPGGQPGGFARKGRFKVNDLLREEDRGEYERMLASAATTVPQLMSWLEARGYDVGSESVKRHRRAFLAELDGIRHSARVATMLTQVARDQGEAAFTEAALTRFEQLLFERLFDTGEHAELDEKQWASLAKSLDSVVDNRRHLEALRREFDRIKRRAAREAGKVAKRGADGNAVAERVRQILGIPADEVE